MSSKKSLADKISGLLNAAPSYNPDENDPEATAKVVDFAHDEEDEDHSGAKNHSQSAFRKKNVSLLDEIDAKYAGKKSSRKDLCDSDDDLQPEYIDQESDSGDESYEDEEDSDEDTEEDDVGVEDDGNFKHMNESNLKVINEKSLCVQNQIRMWENLLEMRIQLQKCLVASNKLPPPAVYKEMKENNEFGEKCDSLKKTLGNTLGNMMELQELLIKKFPESRNALKDTVKQKMKETQPNDDQEEDDEDIPSDTEEDEDEQESEDEDQPAAKRKKLSPNELETKANKLHKSYQNFRNTTIQKWNDKTQIAHGKTASTNPVLKQIEFNLLDKARLIKRTQLKRSEYRILGVEEKATEDDDEMDLNQNENHDYNNNIFDDDDFYHQLLRELIEVKSADITDPIQLSRQWIQLQNLRSKMKRKIDTRATKGRRMRYGVHTKLVNFMAPINIESITDKAQTELFSSLFGKRC